MTDGQTQLEKISKAKEMMEFAQKEFRIHGELYAEAERDYRIALAKKILKLKEEGFAATLTNDLAKGDEGVANLKMARDIESTLMHSAQNAIYNYRLEYKTLNEQAKQDMFG